MGLESSIATERGSIQVSVMPFSRTMTASQSHALPVEKSTWVALPFSAPTLDADSLRESIKGLGDDVGGRPAIRELNGRDACEAERGDDVMLTGIAELLVCEVGGGHLVQSYVGTVRRHEIPEDREVQLRAFIHFGVCGTAPAKGRSQSTGIISAQQPCVAPH